MPTLRAIHNHIIFQFAEQYHFIGGKRYFREITPAGIIIPRIQDESVKSPRWGIVTHIGPEVDKEIEVGSTILIEPLMWTKSFSFEGQLYWRTNSEKVIGIRLD